MNFMISIQHIHDSLFYMFITEYCMEMIGISVCNMQLYIFPFIVSTMLWIWMYVSLMSNPMKISFSEMADSVEIKFQWNKRFITIYPVFLHPSQLQIWSLHKTMLVYANRVVNEIWLLHEAIPQLILIKWRVSFCKAHSWRTFRH